MNRFSGDAKSSLMKSSRSRSRKRDGEKISHLRSGVKVMDDLRYLSKAAPKMCNFLTQLHFFGPKHFFCVDNNNNEFFICYVCWPWQQPTRENSNPISSSPWKEFDSIRQAKLKNSLLSIQLLFCRKTRIIPEKFSYCYLESAETSFVPRRAERTGQSPMNYASFVFNKHPFCFASSNLIKNSAST